MTLRQLLAIVSFVVPVVVAAGPEAVALDAAKPLETPSGIVDGKTARALAQAGAVVVDVRTPEEYAAAHVPGAKNIPHDQIATRAAEIGTPKTPVVVYCRTGRRSALASESLKKLGFDKVWDMQILERWDERSQ